MGYKQAASLLPPELLKQIQQYVDGEYLYIPRRPEDRRKWGELRQTRRYTAERNRQIYSGYLSGTSVQQLADAYFLSSKTIYKIIAAIRNEQTK